MKEQIFFYVIFSSVLQALCPPMFPQPLGNITVSYKANCREDSLACLSIEGGIGDLIFACINYENPTFAIKFRNANQDDYARTLGNYLADCRDNVIASFSEGLRQIQLKDFSMVESVLTIYPPFGVEPDGFLALGDAVRQIWALRGKDNLPKIVLVPSLGQEKGCSYPRWTLVPYDQTELGVLSNPAVWLYVFSKGIFRDRIHQICLQTSWSSFGMTMVPGALVALSVTSYVIWERVFKKRNGLLPEGVRDTEMQGVHYE